jgi:hypothetical protein
MDRACLYGPYAYGLDRQPVVVLPLSPPLDDLVRPKEYQDYSSNACERIPFGGPLLLLKERLPACEQPISWSEAQ